MKRRGFIGSLLAAVAAFDSHIKAQVGDTAVASMPADTWPTGTRTVTQGAPERPLYVVYPACPRCGAYVLFTRRSNFPGDLVPVVCLCGWKGESPVAV